MKDAYYFPHDSNAKDDPKVIMLMEQFGPEGYGIFWILIETLRDQPDYRAPIAILPGIARRYQTTPDKVKAVVFNYNLFVVDDEEFFYSESFSRRMFAIDSKRQKLSEAGIKGNIARWESPPDRKANATRSQVKESKVNKSKENNNTYAPDFEQAWEQYGRKGSKKVAYTEWKNLTSDDRATAMTHIPSYVEANEAEPHFMKDFERYLKQGTFHSIIIERPRKNTFSGAL
jgi:hypothetical protein